jgi:hypothetical protein
MDKIWIRYGFDIISISLLINRLIKTDPILINPVIQDQLILNSTPI